jgi:hypothetical protein
MKTSLTKLIVVSLVIAHIVFAVGYAYITQGQELNIEQRGSVASAYLLCVGMAILMPIAYDAASKN